MDDDWELEDWLLEAGERAERKSIAGGLLSPAERLVREFWVLDIHAQNGGVSQYFCNYGLEQWHALKAAWSAGAAPSLGLVIAEVERVIRGAADPYVTMIDASPDIEDFYEARRPGVLRELRRLAPDA